MNGPDGLVQHQQEDAHSCIRQKHSCVKRRSSKYGNYQQRRGRSLNIQAHFGGSASQQEYVWHSKVHSRLASWF